MVNQASRWSSLDYERNAAFVPALGAQALALLAPQPGELILDLGCGDGALTLRIGEAGARPIGLDASLEMVEAARKRGVEAYVADAEALDLARQAQNFGAFDAAFSNAALHWMLDPEAVAEGVFAILRPGGRFVGEMGGNGNLLMLRRGLREELIAREYAVPAEEPQWYPTIEAFSRIYLNAGFCDIHAELIPRSTQLPSGVADWVKTFRSGWLDVIGVPADQRGALAEAVEHRLEAQLRQEDGNWYADYVRLRFTMRKPE